MYEHRRDKILSRPAFLRRLARHGVASALVVLGSLLMGTVGFHVFNRQAWIDALLNASMLLGGMGPVGDIGPTAGKLFAAAYALYAGLVFLIAVGILFAPMFHRMIHAFHLDQTERERR